MAKARIELEFADPEAAAVRIAQIDAALDRLNKRVKEGTTSAEAAARAEFRLQQARKQQQQAMNQALGATQSLTGHQRQAAEAAQLLAARIGVQLPNSVNKLLAQSRLIGPALNLAFGAGAVLAFGAAIGNLVLPKLQELHESMTGIKKLTEAIQTAAKAATSEVNNLLKAPGATLENQLRNLDNVLAILRQRQRDALVGGFDDFDVRADQLRRLNQAVKVAEDMRDKLKEIQVQRDPIGALRTELGAIAPELIPVLANIRGTAEALGQTNKELTDFIAQSNELTKLQAKKELEEMEKAWQQNASTLDLFNEELREHRDFLIFLKNFKLPPSPLVEATPDIVNRLRDMERDFQIQRAELQGRTVDSMLLQEGRRITETLSGLAKLGASEEQLAQARTILNEHTALKVQQVNQQAFERMAADIEGFFSQVFLTARSFAGVWKQLTQQLVRLFVTAVSRMVAAWALGFRQMQGAVAGGGAGGIGGIIGSIFGGIFGGSGGAGGFGIAGPGGTAVVNSAASSFASTSDFSVTGGTNLGGQRVSLSGGLGATASTIATSLPAAGGGGASATNLTGLARLKAGLVQLLPVGTLLAGSQLLGSGIGRGSPLLGALGGGLLGAGGLLGLSALAGSGAGGLTGLIAGAGLAGPLGLAVVGIAAGIGALLGALSRGKKKRQASRIAEAGFEEMRKVVDEFRRFQTDFDSALAGVDSIWLEMQNAWRQLGGSIFRRSVRGELPEFRQIRGEIEQLQKMREARGALVASLPIPEFEAGGFTNDVFRAISRRDGAMLAILHRDEAVLNSRATQMLGRSFIEQANRAPSFQSGGFVGTRPSDSRPVVFRNEFNIYQQPGESSEQLADRIGRVFSRRARDRGMHFTG